MLSSNRQMALWLMATTLPACALAEDPIRTYDRVEFSVAASASVATDTVVAYLSRQMEGENAATMADQVNKAVTQSVKQIKQIPDIKVETADYQTTPLYQDDRLVGWRVRQSIRLESSNLPKLSGVLGDLQQNLNLDGINYGVTPESMKRAEDALIEQALASYQQRAERVTHGLGRARYRIVALQITNNAMPVHPGMMAARPMAMAEGPTVEPSERKVQVNVMGTIELLTE